MQVQLSAKAARDLRPGETLRDHVVTGLSLRAGAAGKTWMLYYRVGKQERRPALGKFPDLSLEAARAVAKEWKQRIARGEDPSADRQASRVAPTMQELADYYLNDWGPKNYAAATLTDVRNAVRNEILPALGAKTPVRDVTVQAVARMVERKAKTAKTRANRLRAYASKMFQLAESSTLGWRPKRSNPCRDEDVPHYTERKRRTHIKADEFAKLKVAFETQAIARPRHVACLYCILFGGTRVTEMASAKRAWLRGNVLELREHKTAKRTGDVRSIVLPTQAIALLDNLPEHRDGSLFGPGVDKFSLWKVFKAARDAAGLPHIQVRDLRRTFASVAKTGGASLAQIGDIFDHGSPVTTARYAWLFEDAKGELVQSTADAMAALMDKD